MAIRLAWLAIVLPLGGCSYKAEVPDSPAFDVMSSYGSKIPGKWLVYIDARPLDRPIKTSGYVCAAHDFPIHAAAAFSSSVNETLGNVMAEIEIVKSPVPRGDLARYGARGMIVVRGEDVRPVLDVKPGFWQASMETRSLVVASVSVDGPAGRLLGTTVEGHGNATAEAGMFCEGGAKAVANSIAQAMHDTMRKIGEAITNSERIRGAAT